ncbi:UNVERIFIED_CONTAM: Retrovirus-related Pol polyprotein from transposon RE1 [Sesamum calycinum]|uniref:Retrovirus-related Pol polyprotein from transposon RE1 n=1 Tax=Sesamum calycinum TaxID=2727403 RepID=A0AAW2Q3V2_9LAMI
MKTDDTIDKYKVKLVAKGYNQVESIDYGDSFSSLAKTVAVRIMLAIAASLNWSLRGINLGSQGLPRLTLYYLRFGVTKYFLMLEIARPSQGLAVTQSKYIKDILAGAGMSQAKAAITSLPTGLKFTSEVGNILPDPKPYRRLVGRLLYLGVTRPDSHASQ